MSTLRRPATHANSAPKPACRAVLNPRQHTTDSLRQAESRVAKPLKTWAIRPAVPGHLEKAEAALQDALIADVSYAPAHNNLGRIYFEQGRLYLAAWEFEYARRLLTDSAEVTNNLGMVYEAAEQMPRAIEDYRMAVAMEPGNSEYAGNLARALLRDGQDSAEVAGLLQNVVFNDTRPEWIAWARDQLNLHMPVPASAPTVTPRQPAGAERLPPPRQMDAPLPSQHLDDLSPGPQVNELPLPSSLGLPQ